MEGQKEIKLSFEIFFFEAFLFLVNLFLGIFVAFRINEILKIEKITLPQISFWNFLIYFLVATLFFLFISYFLKRKSKKGIIFKGLFVFVNFLGGAIALEGLGIPNILPPILMAILIFSWLKISLVFIHDLIIILGIAGIGSTLGLSLQPEIVIILLVIFSIYDFIAVYKTKHMIRMAKEMIEVGAIIGLICPQRISDFKARLKEVQPGGKFLILGGGDVAFPLFLAVSLIPQGVFFAFIISIFALFGLALSFGLFIFQKVRQPIPALPPIALFSMIGFLITKLIQ